MDSSATVTVDTSTFGISAEIWSKVSDGTRALFRGALVVGFQRSIYVTQHNRPTDRPPDRPPDRARNETKRPSIID